MTMTAQAELLINPCTTERLTVLASTPEVFRISFELAPGERIAGLHAHPNQAQTLEVVDGTLACQVGDERVVLGAGAHHIVKPGVVHDQANPGDVPVTVIEEYRPARRMHAFFRTLFALARDGYTTRRGRPYPLVAAALFTEFADSISVASRGERIALAILRPFARLFRRDRLIRAYLDGHRDDAGHGDPR